MNRCEGWVISKTYLRSRIAAMKEKTVSMQDGLFLLSFLSHLWKYKNKPEWNAFSAERELTLRQGKKLFSTRREKMIALIQKPGSTK